MSIQEIISKIEELKQWEALMEEAKTKQKPSEMQSKRRCMKWIQKNW